MDLLQGSDKSIDDLTSVALHRMEQAIVCETETKRIDEMRKDGWRIAKLVENHFGDDYCRIDGFLLIRR